MFLPIGDYPNPPQTAWVTRALIAANVLIYVFLSLPLSMRTLTPEELRDPEIEDVVREIYELEHGAVSSDVRMVQWVTSVPAYQVFVYQHGYQPGRPSLADLFFSMFLHGGFLHLLGNMLFLWIFGDNVEARLGRLLYLVAYLVTGALATLSFALMARSSLVPLVGASGAISGVLGFYFVWFPKHRVKVFVWFGYLFTDVIHIHARYVLGFYVLIDNLLPILLGARTGVAYGAHLGGFCAGALGALMHARLKHPVVPRESSGAEDVFRSAQNSLRAGDEENAYQGLRRYLSRFPNGPHTAQVHLGLGVLLARHVGRAVAAREHLLSAIDIAGPESDVARAARLELERLASS